MEDQNKKFEEHLEQSFERLKVLIDLQRKFFTERDKMYPDHSAIKMFIESILFKKQISKEVTHRYRWLGILWWIVVLQFVFYSIHDFITLK